MNLLHDFDINFLHIFCVVLKFFNQESIIIIKRGHRIKAGFICHYGYVFISSNDNAIDSTIFFGLNLFCVTFTFYMTSTSELL
jgi:hypothetical protein